MSHTRIYQNQDFSCTQIITLDTEASHKLKKVLRLNNGDTITLFNGKENAEYRACITSMAKTTTVEIKQKIITASHNTANMHLIQGICRQDKMDFVIQKAVELGIASFTPLINENKHHSFNKKAISKKMQHWQKVIISACEQSGCNVLPKLNPPITPKDFLNNIKLLATDTALLFSLHDEKQLSLAKLKLSKQTENIFILIGSEGGFTKEEVTGFIQNGFTNYSLGTQILRAETAPIVVLSILKYLWDLKLSS
ncbi:MAG: 16S rRNA (uracil(1498)-N(3))-methyltransferase [Thiotrichales bacterium]|nr:MAG: 16S rRNA (uracil(1498)-N(3))-methyltransferase [Thiotrichales bacterium]